MTSFRVIFALSLLCQALAPTALLAQKTGGWPRPIPLEQAVLPKAPSEPHQRIYAAFSIKVAEQLIRKAVADHADFRTNKELYDLGGISKPKGIIWDDLTDSWIVFGEKLIEESDLTLDDVAVALRVRFANVTDDPGVSIDPVTEVFRDSAGGSVTQTAIQNVRFMGALTDTAFGKTCYEADWLMKRISFGLEGGPVAGIDQRTPSSDSIPASRVEITDRFWLEPKSELKVFEGKLVAIEQLDIRVRTEFESAKRIDGTALDPSSSFVTETRADCEAFAERFSGAYEEVARRWPVYKRLRGLARLAAIGKGLAILGNRDNIGFFIDEYNPEVVATPRSVPMIGPGFSSNRTFVCGGVLFKAPTVDLRAQIIAGSESQIFVDAIKTAVLGKRPSADSLTWPVELDAKSFDTRK